MVNTQIKVKNNPTLKERDTKLSRRLALDWNLRLLVLNLAQKSSKELIEEAQKPKQVQKAARWSVVPKELIGYETEVHNGKGYVRIKIVKEMVGHRFGEFATTTAWYTPKKDDAKATQKAKAAAGKSTKGKK